MISEQLKMCIACGEILPESNFYSFKNNEKDYICKACILKDENDLNENTFLGILKRYDVPYIPKEWEYLREREIERTIKNKDKYHPIIGKYLSKMKLCSFRSFGFKDSMHFINYDATEDYYQMLKEEGNNE